MSSINLQHSGADISSCGQYRYKLWRIWDANTPLCNYIMLNPSTADAIKNDHTITKCINRAKVLGYGGILVSNLFAYRSTNPKFLKTCSDPIGPSNDSAILDCVQQSGITICAWGGHGKLFDRSKIVRKMLEDMGIRLHHLGLSKEDFPLHPAARGKTRCIGYDISPLPF